MLYDPMYNSFNILTLYLKNHLICGPSNIWHLLKDKLRLDHRSMTWKSYLILWVHFWAFIHKNVGRYGRVWVHFNRTGSVCVNFADFAKVIWTKQHWGFLLGKTSIILGLLMTSKTLILFGMLMHCIQQKFTKQGRISMDICIQNTKGLWRRA